MILPSLQIWFKNSILFCVNGSKILLWIFWPSIIIIYFMFTFRILNLILPCHKICRIFPSSIYWFRSDSCSRYEKTLLKLNLIKKKSATVRSDQPFAVSNSNTNIWKLSLVASSLVCFIYQEINELRTDLLTN